MNKLILLSLAILIGLFNVFGIPFTIHFFVGDLITIEVLNSNRLLFSMAQYLSDFLWLISGLLIGLTLTKKREVK